MRRAFGFAVFHSFSVELRLDAGLSGVDRPRACPLATSVPSWTSHQTTVMVIGFGHDRRSAWGATRVHEECHLHHDDDELNTNPPTPCQIGKRPPAPKPKRESAGHQGVAGGGCGATSITHAPVGQSQQPKLNQSKSNPNSASLKAESLGRYKHVENTSQWQREPKNTVPQWSRTPNADFCVCVLSGLAGGGRFARGLAELRGRGDEPRGWQARRFLGSPRSHCNRPDRPLGRGATAKHQKTPCRPARAARVSSTPPPPPSFPTNRISARGRTPHRAIESPGRRSPRRPRDRGSLCALPS